MTGPVARHEPTDPAARARDGVEAPVRPVIERRRGPREQAGLIAVAAVAIAVVAAGIGLFDGGRDDDLGPVASASSGPATPGTPASPGAAAPATALPGTTCLPVTPGDLPELTLVASDDDGEPARGNRGRSDQVGRSSDATAWSAAAPDRALVLDPSASMVVVADARACLRAVVAEYVDSASSGRLQAGTMLLEIGDGPPRSQLDLGGLPDGDWVVRVVVEYATGAGSHSDWAVEERFFRVFAGSGPGANPLVRPAVPCEPLPAGALPPQLELVADDGVPVVGVDLSVRPGAGIHAGAIVAGTFPERLQLRVVGNACATSWLVQLMDPVTRDVLNENTQENAGENPFYVAQNRMDLPNMILGHTIVEAAVDFGRDVSAFAGWDVTIAAAEPPTVRVIGPGGASVTARRGCGSGWTLADGRNAWEPCPMTVVPDDTELLRVRSGRAIRLEVADWTLVSWWTTCGERGPDGTSYQETVGCVLGGGGDGINDANPAMFLPLPGRYVVGAWITSLRDGDTVGAQYFVEIEAMP